MQVEHVARIGLTAGRTAEDQGNFTVGHGLLAQVIVDDQGRTAGIPEIFSDGGAGERGIILKRSRVGGGGGDDDGVVHGPLGAEGLDDVRHGAALLADSHIDAVYRLAGEVFRTLVDDRIEGDGGLAGLTVADNQLTLAAADRDHGVDGLQTGLQRLADRLPVDDPRGLAFERHRGQFSLDAAESVQRVAQRIDHAADHGLPHRDRSDPPRPLDVLAFLDQVGRSQEDSSDIVLFEVHHHAHDTACEFEEFAGFRAGKAVDAGDAVADLQDFPYLFILYREVDRFQLLQEHVGNLARTDIDLRHYTIRLFLLMN